MASAQRAPAPSRAAESTRVSQSIRIYDFSHNCLATHALMADRGAPLNCSTRQYGIVIAQQSFEARFLGRAVDHSRTLRAKVFAKATRADSYFRKNQEVQMADKHDSKRELIDTGKDKRYVRRDAKGRFDDVVDVGR